MPLNDPYAKAFESMTNYHKNAYDALGNTFASAAEASNNFLKGLGNLGGQVAETAGGVPDALGGALSFLTGGTGIGALAGLGQQLASNLIGDGKEREIWEKEKQNALAQTLANRESILAMNPEANRRQAAASIQNAMSGAQAAAMNAASGQGNYAGGDVGFAAGAGARNSAVAQQAISPMAQQLAGLFGQRSQEEMQKRQMLDQNSMQQAQIRDMSAYVKDAATNPFNNLLQSMFAGHTAYTTGRDQLLKNQTAQN